MARIGSTLLLLLAASASAAGAIPLEVFAPEGRPAPVNGDLPFTAVDELRGRPNGRAAFVASVEGLDSEFNRAVWLRDEDGSLHEGVRRRDPAPGTDDAFFFNFDEVGVREDGTYLFEAEIRGPGIDGSTNGVWRGDPDGQVTFLALEGGSLPGLGGEALVERITPFARAGEIFASASFANPGTRSGWWWLDPVGALEPLVFEGGLAPDGGVFQSVAIAQFGAGGRIAFRARTSVDRERRLWLRKEDGSFGEITESDLDPVRRFPVGDILGAGDVLEVAPGDLRALLGAPGSARILEDRFVARVFFEDETAGLVFGVVPEPSSALLLGTALAGLGWRRRSGPRSC